MSEEFDIVSGEFEGNFFTQQKSVLTTSEWNALKKEHAINLYRGELKNISKETVYEPEEFRNRESILLHNVTNVQFHSKNSAGENTSKIYDFEQLLIRDAEIKDSWELNGKTYGIITGKIIGKVQKRNSNFDASNPPPQNDTEIPKLKPEQRFNNTPPSRQEITDYVRRGGGYLTGCLSNIWRLLFALILLIILLWLLRGCVGDYLNSEGCCSERDRLEFENEDLKRRLDSLEQAFIHIQDSLELNKIQEEIDNLSSKVYFKGNSDEILKYSEIQINKIVDIITQSGNLELEIRGYHNGSINVFEDLDLKRATKVKEMLIDKGISSNLINAIAMGQSYLDDEHYLEEIIINGELVKWNRNMRVEIKIIKY